MAIYLWKGAGWLLGRLDVGRLDLGPMVGQRVSFAERLPAWL
jgi:hypothetical protein